MVFIHFFYSQEQYLYFNNRNAEQEENRHGLTLNNNIIKKFWNTDII